MACVTLRFEPLAARSVRVAVVLLEAGFVLVGVGVDHFAVAVLVLVLGVLVLVFDVGMGVDHSIVAVLVAVRLIVLVVGHFAPFAASDNTVSAEVRATEAGRACSR